MGRIVINTAIDNTGLEKGYSKADAATSRFVSSVAKNIGGISNALNKVDIKSLSDALDKQNNNISAQKKIVAELEAEYKRLSNQESAQLENAAALMSEQGKLAKQIAAEEKALAAVIQKREELAYIATASTRDSESATKAQLKQDAKYLLSLENKQRKMIEISERQEDELSAKLAAEEKALAGIVQKREELAYIATASTGDWESATKAQVKQDSKYLLSLEEKQEKIIEISKLQDKLSEKLAEQDKALVGIIQRREELAIAIASAEDHEGATEAQRNQEAQRKQDAKYLSSIEDKQKKIIEISKLQDKLSEKLAEQDKALVGIIQRREELAIAIASAEDHEGATEAQRNQEAQRKQDAKYLSSIEDKQKKIIELSKRQDELSVQLAAPASMEAYKIAPQLESANEALMDMIFNAGSIRKELENARIEAERLYEAATAAEVEITPTITEAPEAPVEVVPEVSPVAIDEVAQEIQQAIEPEITPEITPEISAEEVLPAADRIEEIIEENARPVIRPDIESMSIAELEKGLVRSQSEADRLAKNIEAVQAKVYAFEDRQHIGEVLSEAEYERYSMARAKLEDLGVAWQAATDSAAQYQARIEEINATPPVEPPAPTTPASAADLVSRFKAGASAVVSFAKKAMSTIGSIMSKVGNGIKSVASKAASGIKAMAGKISGFMRRTTKDTSGLTDAIGKTLNRIKGLLVSALVFNVMSKAFKDFRDYIEAALMKNKEFVTSMGHLKGAMQSTFTPILNYIVPAITTLVSWLATAMSYVARFVQMMSGQVVTTNKAGDSTTALSKGMDDLAGSTKAAGDAAKRSLAPFDLLNQLSDTSAGGGGGAAATPEIPTLAPVKIDTSWIDEFVKKLKDIDVDYEYFFGIGQRVGEWINKGLKAIDWAWIQAWTVSTVTKIAAFLNGAVAGIDWTLVGYAMAQGFNAALIAAYTWLTTFDFSAWGVAIGTGINGMIYNIRWGMIGDTLAAYFMSVINTIENAINTVDWVYLGAHLALSINRFFNGVNWAEAGGLISNGMNSALAFLITAITETDWNKVGEDIAKFLNGAIHNIRWGQIGDTLAAFVTSAINTLSGAINKVDWVYLGAHLSLSINRFFNGINWKEAGQLISNGMKAALAFLTTAITETDWKKIGQDVAEFLKSIDWKGVWDDFKLFIGAIFTGFEDFLVGLLGTTGAENAINGLKIAVGALSGALIVLGASWLISLGPMALVVLGVAGIGAAIAAVDWTGFFESASSGFGILVEKFHEENKAIGDWVTDQTTAFQNWKKAANDNIFANLESWGNDFATWVNGMFDKETWTKKAEGMKQGFMTGWEATKQWFYDGRPVWWDEYVAPLFNKETWATKAKGMKEGFQTAWDAVKTWFYDGRPVWWDEYVAPLFDKEKWSKLGVGIKDGIMGAWDTFAKDWTPTIQAWFTDVETGFKTLKTNIVTAVSTAWAAVVSVWEGAKGWFSRTIIDPIKDLFTGMWTSIKSGINSFFIKIENGLNKMVDAVNSVRIDIPTFTNPITGTIYGGGWVGFNMDRFALPRLATGAVIPPNKEFAAILGDQKSGTNIETPEALMRQTFSDVLANSGLGNGNVNVTIKAEGDAGKLIRFLKFSIEQEGSRQGVSLSTRVVTP